jgi:hypothetical protein
MAKLRTISGLVSRIISEDSKYRLINVVRDNGRVTVTAYLSSVIARDALIDCLDLPVTMKDHLLFGDNSIYIAVWDATTIGRNDKLVTPFRFDGSDDAKRARRRVTEQENRAAQMIGGKRHVGSGAISDLKSDASSMIWQLEAKQTRAQSIAVKLDWLSKISEEAMSQDKRPILHIEFSHVPDNVIVENEWVMMSRSSFEAGRW